MLGKYICIFIAAAMMLTLCSCGSIPSGNAEDSSAEISETESSNLTVVEETIKSAGENVEDAVKEGVEGSAKGSAEGPEAVFTQEDILSKADASFSLGSATLTVDENKKAVAVYKPLGGPVSLELKDKSGNTWRLDIPENALSYEETIIMQLTKNIKSDLFAGQSQAGIVLQPEGLQFTKSATLSVTGAKEKTCLFFGTCKGEKLNFWPSTVEGNSLKAEIWHFSSYINYTPTSDQELDKLTTLAEDAYKKILAEVKDFLKTPVSLPQMAPNYDFRCEAEDGTTVVWARNRALDLYMEAVLAPENYYLSKLVGAGREVAVLGGEQDALYYGGLLVNRNIRKVDKLIRTYKNDVNKLIPVMNLTFAVIKQAARVGLDIPTGAYLEVLSEWMARAADKQIEKIREEHDYKLICVVHALIEGSLILNSDFKLSQEFSQKYLQKIKDAMTFTVHYDASLHSGIANQKMKLEGEIKLSWLDDENQKVFTGTGKGKYLSYSHSGPGNTTINFPNTYPVEMKFLEFSPCTSKTIDVQVDKIGADVEVWKIPEFNETSSDEYSFVNFMADELFKEYKGESEKFVFKVPYKNKNVIMGKEGFTKTAAINYPEEGGASGSITYNLEIKHTPK